MHTIVATAATAALVLASTANAFADSPELKGALNGTFGALSNGDLAKSNDMYYNQPTVSATWTISTTCTNPTDCTGTVISDQGWTAPIYKMSNLWNIKRVVPNWAPCPDGTAPDGHQHYRFYAVNAHTGQADNNQDDLFAGLDETTSPSGACGVNKPLLISMPFQLSRTGG